MGGNYKWGKGRREKEKVKGFIYTKDTYVFERGRVGIYCRGEWRSRGRRCLLWEMGRKALGKCIVGKGRRTRMGKKGEEREGLAVYVLWKRGLG